MDSDSWCTPPEIADPLHDFFGGNYNANYINRANDNDYVNNHNGSNDNYLCFNQHGFNYNLDKFNKYRVYNFTDNYYLDCIHYFTYYHNSYRDKH